MPNYLQAMRAFIGKRKIIHPGARIIIENEQGEILLIRRRDNDQWGLIAGGLEEGESIAECMIREVQEETGLQIENLEAIGLSTKPTAETVQYPNGDVVQYFTVVFYCREWSGTIAQQTEEAKAIRFFDPADLPKLSPNEAPSLHWLQQFKETGQFILA